MKIIDYICCGALSIFAALVIVALYDAFVFTPRIKAAEIKVIDTNYIFSYQGDLVNKGAINLEQYKSRLAAAESLIRSENIVLNKSITIDGKPVPIVFGGRDITDYVLEHMDMEAIK